MRALVAVVGVLVMLLGLPATAAAQGDGEEQIIVKEGRFEPVRPDWAYVPFDVPAGVRQIHVAYEYNRVGGNALDIGIFDTDGYELGNAAGFRGWSGGSKTEFSLSRSEATPGYVPGAIEPGEWNLILGPYQVAPAGLEWKATITLRFGAPGERFRPEPAPARAAGGEGWYRGDLHLHTVHSDGTYLPEEVVDGAVAAGLDFMVSTEHNTQTANWIWGRHARSDLLIIPGEEITTRNGHYNALGLRPGQWIDWRYRAEDGQIGRFLREIHGVGGLAMINHPYCPFVGCDWRFGYDGMDAIEVWNGPWTLDDDAAVSLWDRLLRQGEELKVAGGASDAHRPGQVIGLPQTVVHARRLSRAAVLDGIAAGEAYVTESSATELAMSARAGSARAELGGRLRVGRGREATVRVRVEGAAGTTASVITDRGVEAAVPIADDDETLTYSTRARDARYVRVEVRRADRSMVALTNPIFLGRR